jgi:hypothetical protein
MAYVSEYGNYGGENIIVFDDDLLTPKQWEILGIVNDYDKIDYVQAIIDGRDLSEWEVEDYA